MFIHWRVTRLLIRSLVVLVFLTCLSSQAWATIYRFSTSGNDNTGDGSVATPYKTLGLLNTKLATLTGDDKILLKAGDEWNTATFWGAATNIHVTVSGTSGHPITAVGAYDAAHPNGLARTDTFTRPIINGDIDGDNVPEKPLAVLTACSQYYTYMIHIDYQDYVTIENIEIKNASGEGIRVDSGVGNKIHNCKISYTQMSAITIPHGATNTTIEYSDLSYASLSRNRHSLAMMAGCFSVSVGPAGIGGSGSTYSTIQYNTIHHTEGEGINPYHGADYATIKGNKLYSVMRPAIYNEGNSHTIVAYNLVFNGDDNAWPSWGGIGIGLENPSSGAHGNAVFGNLVAGIQKYGGLYSVNQKSNVNTDTYDNVFYNNTVVDCQYGIMTGGTSYGGIAITLRNNAFIKYESSTMARKDGAAVVTASYNYWTQTPTYYGDIGTDVVNPSPLLIGTSGWLTLPSTEDGSSFVPQVGSPLIDRVAGIGGDYNILPLSGSTWPTAITTGDATTKIKPNTPTLTCAEAPNPLSVTPTFVASAFAETGATPVDFGAVQLNMSGSQTHAFWQVCEDPTCGTVLSTTPATNTDDATNKTQLTLTAALNPGVSYFWRVRYKDNAYSPYPTACAFYAVPGQTPTGSGGAVLSAPGAGKGGATLTAPGAGKGGATLVGPP